MSSRRSTGIRNAVPTSVNPKDVAANYNPKNVIGVRLRFRLDGAVLEEMGRPRTNLCAQTHYTRPREHMGLCENLAGDGRRCPAAKRGGART